MPSQYAQPQVSLLPGGKAISVQWKAPKKLYSEIQASTQQIKRDSSRFMGYSDNIQLMVKAGVCPAEGYHRGAPQIIRLNVECTGKPVVNHWKVPTKETVLYKGKQHVQCNSMYVCTLKVAGDRHDLSAQPQNAGNADFGFLGSQNSAGSTEPGGGGGDRRNADQQERVIRGGGVGLLESIHIHVVYFNSTIIY